MLPPTFVSSCEISGVIVNRAHEAGAKGPNRANANACLLREEKDNEISVFIYIFFCRKNREYIAIYIERANFDDNQ